MYEDALYEAILQDELLADMDIRDVPHYILEPNPENVVYVEVDHEC